MTAHNAAPGCATRWATLWLVAALSVVAVAAQADHLNLGNEGVYPPFSMVSQIPVSIRVSRQPALLQRWHRPTAI
jgi:hypothetical protein